jgi:VanZ family protein
MLKVKNFIPGIAWFFLVLILICLPGKSLPHASSFLDKIFFDKWVHAGLFGMLTFLFLRPFTFANIENKKTIAIKIVMAIIVWGLTTEFIQKYFIPFRSFDLWDWAADSAGAIAAYIYMKNKLH